MKIGNQFLFIIADTNSEDDKILSELEKAVDGENVAIIYNSSVSAPDCQVCFWIERMYQIL